jgi:hypothetical protein
MKDDRVISFFQSNIQMFYLDKQCLQSPLHIYTSEMDVVAIENKNNSSGQILPGRNVRSLHSEKGNSDSFLNIWSCVN